MKVKTRKCQFLLVFISLLFGCAGTSVNGDKTSKNSENFEIAYAAGQSYLTIRTILTEEETAEGKVSVYKFDKYFTVIDALDAENIPVAGRRVYDESFFEITGQRNLKGEGIFQNKTVIFKPGSIPSVEGNPVDEKYTAGLRLTGFEHIFLPENIKNDGKFHPIEMIESKKRILKAFLTELGIVPDESAISARITKNENDKIMLQFSWHVSGIILGKQGVGVELNFEGKIAYSKKHKGITYFELVRNADGADKSKLRLIINRDFEKIYKDKENE